MPPYPPSVGEPRATARGGVSRDDFTYTACYCEENVHLLCRELGARGLARADVADLFVVFVSNANRAVPLWQQRAGAAREGGVVVWDYHVLCVQAPPGRASAPAQSDPAAEEAAALVWDLDTLLPLPCPLPAYARGTFWAGREQPLALAPQYERLFRVVHAPLFLKHCASDRSHMLRRDGTWLAPPPAYPCIVAADGNTNNLQGYISMSGSEEAGGDEGRARTALQTAALGVVVGEGHLLGMFNSITLSGNELSV